MAFSRPVTCLYSESTVARVTLANHSRIGRSTTVQHAIIAATRRVVESHFERGDIYNQFGLHVYSIVRGRFGSIRITYVGDSGKAL